MYLHGFDSCIVSVINPFVSCDGRNRIRYGGDPYNFFVHFNSVRTGQSSLNT
jgi:hypothetical protein